MSTIRNLVYNVVIAMLFISGCTSQAPATPLPLKAVTAPTATATQTLPTTTPEPTPEIDPAAQHFAPNFSSAGLGLLPENKLLVDATSTTYELELSNLAYSYTTEEMVGYQDRLGIFSLEQPMDSGFNLMMSLVLFPGQQWTGNWLVANQDASQFCGGSIDLLPLE